MILQRNRFPYFCLIPGLVLVALFSLFPFIDTLVLSFKNSKTILPDETFNGFHNYKVLVSYSRFWHALFFTLLFTFVSISLEAIVGLCFGLMLNLISEKKGFLRIFILIPWIIPTVVTARMWQWMLDYNLGILNYLLGIIEIGRINWLGNSFVAFLSLVMADVWKTSPFVAIIVWAGLSAIPREIYKASIIDGANSWQSFRYITLPLILPILGVAVLFRAIDTLRIFDLVYVLTGGGPGGATETLSVYSYRLFFYKGDFGQGAAASVFILLLVAGFSYFYMKKSFGKTETNQP
ncbi:trehalose/maltose transport system permease protein MalF [Candidatus Kuenenia stuttgartiensis]|uniref:Strongly similar to trehalose/maltose transport protein MalF n=1 Tax=Kuenenia stuttgartiensis TaxID=174633 RepID=A0A2C9CH39_KUEST|nr:sugar ABC transporter permease [Candidatus Kuenenia stuttgartiensis]MBE7545987.1 sugar ABC transporter permease [Planctomycetia bacterium]MBW7941977.1 sugar ABC transporter permease [Candidatus Kuenenia stuttgartiensis]MBZ0190412.1 sugar ABC transporter permease [Candidatus Kuenenia stuttgartiensis]MCF6153552.1 sugar ABC transporter permease [Candidatus Kuenenia stuttgartiensis]MCL4726999.1 sugar ABC transporter permease [Candidatus Kuenenia stuttgartiensis]